MPFQLSIQAALDAQKTALDTTINAARDNVKADNVTQITAQNTSLTNAVNAARDDVKADNATKINAQNTALTDAVNAARDNVNTNTNAKGAVKSVQRGTATGGGTITIAAVNTAKSFVLVNASGSESSAGVTTADYAAAAATGFAPTGKLTSSTSLVVDIKSSVSVNMYQGPVSLSRATTAIEWQVIELF